MTLISAYALPIAEVIEMAEDNLFNELRGKRQIRQRVD